MTNRITVWWQKIPTPLRVWLKGAEISVSTAVLAAIFEYPTTDFTSKAGWSKFLVSIGALSFGALRLYMTQSPIQNVVKQVTEEKAVSVGDVTVEAKRTETTTTTGPEK